MWANRTPFRQPFVETADAVFADGAPGCVVVYVDAWTAYGGSQFVDSPGTGRYHSYLCDEIVPWVDAHYRTIPDRESRAIAGKSSGGFGAMITPMLRPDLFGALATHAGDSLYELCYVPDFGKAVRALRGYDHDIQAWWADFRARPAFTKPEDDDAAGAARRRGVLLGRRGRHAGAAVRPGDRRAAAGACGSAGWTGTRCGWSAGHADGAQLAAGGVDRRGPQRRVLPRRRRGGVPGGAERRAAGRPGPLRAVRRRPRRRSTTGTRCRWPGWRKGWRAERTSRCPARRAAAASRTPPNAAAPSAPAAPATGPR